MTDFGELEDLYVKENGIKFNTEFHAYNDFIYLLKNQRPSTDSQKHQRSLLSFSFS